MAFLLINFKYESSQAQLQLALFNMLSSAFGSGDNDNSTLLCSVKANKVKVGYSLILAGHVMMMTTAKQTLWSI